MHVELGLQATTHRANLDFSAETFSYKPIGKCNHEPFEVRTKEIRVERGRALLGLALVNLRVPNPSNIKKEMALNLGAEDPAKVDAITRVLASISR